MGCAKHLRQGPLRQQLPSFKRIVSTFCQHSAHQPDQCMHPACTYKHTSSHIQKQMIFVTKPTPHVHATSTQVCITPTALTAMTGMTGRGGGEQTATQQKLHCSLSATCCTKTAFWFNKCIINTGVDLQLVQSPVLKSTCRAKSYRCKCRTPESHAPRPKSLSPKHPASRKSCL